MIFFGFLFTPVEVSSPLQKYNGGLLTAQHGWRRSLCGEGESCGSSRSWGCWTSSQPSRQLRLELKVKRLNQTVYKYLCKYLRRFIKWTARSENHLGVEAKVDDGVDAHGGLGEHGRQNQEVERCHWVGFETWNWSLYYTLSRFLYGNNFLDRLPSCKKLENHWQNYSKIVNFIFWSDTLLLAEKKLIRAHIYNLQFRR